MKDLLISITKGLVQNPDAISVDVSEPDEEGVIVYHLHVAEEDMGRVIGSRAELPRLSVLLCVLQQQEMMQKFL